jgi:hypothetical protein
VLLKYVRLWSPAIEGANPAGPLSEIPDKARAGGLCPPD